MISRRWRRSRCPVALVFPCPHFANTFVFAPLHLLIAGVFALSKVFIFGR
ncbi:MAG: hypothetical protein U5Q44_03125 [Dehalococcoidia bacterium]|nr:hypothetical protein [Dehalococcoidia bacterium]